MIRHSISGGASPQPVPAGFGHAFPVASVSAADSPTFAAASEPYARRTSRVYWAGLDPATLESGSEMRSRRPSGRYVRIGFAGFLLSTAAVTVATLPSGLNVCTVP